jgi:redox-sensitive bicupin YhaK (pirin superfamily)
MGATARFGEGDIQWMTAGRGVVHSEMFPLVAGKARNPTELFQIWLNLPASQTMIEPDFTMFWREEVPLVRVEDPSGRGVEVEVIVGTFDGRAAPAPPAPSWAVDPAHDVQIWRISPEPGVSWDSPPASGGVRTRFL